MLYKNTEAEICKILRTFQITPEAKILKRI